MIENILLFFLALTLLFMFVLPFEMVWTKMINDKSREEILSKKEVKTKLLKKHSYKKDEFVTPAFIAINPGLWILMNTLKKDETIYIFEVFIEGKLKNIKVSKSIYDQHKEGKDVTVSVKETMYYTKASVFEMLASEAFKRNLSFHDFSYSIK